MYDDDGFTVPNDIGRYALGDRDPLVPHHQSALLADALQQAGVGQHLLSLVDVVPYYLGHRDLLAAGDAHGERYGADPFCLPGLHFLRESAESMRLNEIRSGHSFLFGIFACTYSPGCDPNNIFSQQSMK